MGPGIRIGGRVVPWREVKLMRSLAASLIVMAAACGLSACGSASSSGPSVAEVNQAATRINSDLAAYLAIKAPTSLTAHGWQMFFSNGDRLVGKLASDFRSWSVLLDESIKAGTGPQNPSKIEAYRNALGQWVKDQQQQARLSKACIGTRGMNAATVSGVAHCYEGMFATYGSKWQTDASKVNSLKPGLR